MEDKKQRGETGIEVLLGYANSILATLREPFLVLDKKLQVISANRVFYTTFKVTEKDAIGRLLPDLGNKQWEIPKLLQLLKEIISEKKVVKDYEVEHKFEQIGQRVMCLNARHLRVSKKIAAIIAAEVREEEEEEEEEEKEELILLAIEDITERKETEEALKESEAKFKAIFNESTDGMLLTEVETRRFFMRNPKLCQMLGYTEEELMRMGIDDIHPKEDLPFIIEQFERQAKGEIKLAAGLPVKRKDGSIFYADISVSPITLAGGKYLIGSFRDITESKKIHDELEEKMQDLERFSKFAVDRELKMEELEKKVKELEQKLKAR
jgi:PAS domain S-box-containing protein